jgi:hypothetical protein
MNIRPLCQACYQKPAAINYIKDGVRHFRSRCDGCVRKSKKIKPRKTEWMMSGYKKKPHCEKCGFKAEYTEQLAVYHIDGNLKNTNPLNLKTVCVNCQIAIAKQGLGWKQGDLIPDF